MIRDLRRRHRLIWIALAILLPLAYALALWSRPSPVLPSPAVPAEATAVSPGADP